MYYSKQAIGDLTARYASLDKRHEKIVTAFITCEFKSKRAAEFSRHGFSRRLQLMLHCIKKVFELIPPEIEGIPSRDDCTQALVNIQTYIVNTYGVIDNLAWIWVEEKKIGRPDGGSLPKDWVGLGPKNSAVLATLSDDFRAHLKSLKDWFRYLEDFRHSLAHRIPMYIPPYIIEEKDSAEYEGLGRAIAKCRDPWRRARLQQQQDKLKKFAPWIQHSFGEKSKRIVFHPQLLRDFETVEEMGWKMLKELDRDIPEIPRWRRWLVDLRRVARLRRT